MRHRRPRTVPKTACAYCRVSTDADRQALGLDAQRAAIATWAAREGVQVLAEHVEEVSGGAALQERAGLLAALADVGARRAAFLVVAKLDRFSRDATSAVLASAELERHGATLAICDGHGEGDDPMSKLVRSLLLGVGEFERAMIKARIKAALEVKRKRGELTGTAPYGFRVSAGPLRAGKDGTLRPVALLVPDPDEQAVIARVRALRAEGMSLRAVEAELAARGVVGRRGRPLKLPTIHAITARDVPATLPATPPDDPPVITDSRF